MGQDPNSEPRPGDVVLTNDDVQDVVIIRPGLQNPDDPNRVLIKPEQVTPRSDIKPLDIVLFYDKHSKIPVQEGVNQQAFVVDDKRGLYIREMVHSISLSELRKKPEALVVRGVPEPVAPFVAKMLLRYRWRPTMFRFATNFIRAHNYGPFIMGNLFPPDTSYDSDEEYQVAWQRFTSILEPSDYLLTFDRTSLLSKIIARGTHGPFNHIAHYIGDAKLWEVVTSGTRIVPLETYRGPQYRVAGYRNYGHSFVTEEEAALHHKETAGRPGYNYSGALRAGIRTCFGDREANPATPNGIILGGSLAFIGQV